MPRSSARNHIASFEASHVPTYSASHVEFETVFCLRAAHDITPEPREKQYPEIDQRVSRQATQLESVNPFRSTVLGPLRYSLNVQEPFR